MICSPTSSVLALYFQSPSFAVYIHMAAELVKRPNMFCCINQTHTMAPGSSSVVVAFYKAARAGVCLTLSA